MQNFMIRNLSTTVLFITLSMFTFIAQAVEFYQASVTINKIELEVEYAKTFEQRARGLMYRESLCTDCGMLFEYPQPRIAGMWMKNTLIPLDVAFIDESGKITDIRAMQAHDLTSINSSTKVLYALEMNLGWFYKHNIKVGQMVEINTP